MRRKVVLHWPTLISALFKRDWKESLLSICTSATSSTRPRSTLHHGFGPPVLCVHISKLVRLPPSTAWLEYEVRYLPSCSVGLKSAIFPWINRKTKECKLTFWKRKQIVTVGEKLQPVGIFYAPIESVGYKPLKPSEYQLTTTWLAAGFYLFNGKLLAYVLAWEVTIWFFQSSKYIIHHMNSSFTISWKVHSHIPVMLCLGAPNIAARMQASSCLTPATKRTYLATIPRYKRCFTIVFLS